MGRVEVGVATAALGVPMLTAIVLAFSRGGFFISDWGLAAIVLLGLVAGVALATRGGVGGVAGIAALTGLVGLAAWQGASAAWSNEPAASQSAMGLTLLYAAAFALGLLGLRRGGWLPWVGAGALFAAWVPVALGLSARLLPGLVGDDTMARLTWPVTYWNGLGALAAFGFVLAVGLAGSPHLDTALRAAAIAITPVFGLTLYLTLSRGAMVAAALMLLTLMLAGPNRLETVATAAVALVATAAVCVQAEQQGNLVALSGVLPEHATQGHAVAGVLVMVMGVTAAVGWLLPTIIGRMTAPARTGLGAAVVAVALLALVGGWIVRGPGGSPVAWVSDQAHAFTSSDLQARSDDSAAARLAVAAGSGRWQNWTVAWDEWHTAPLAGTGAGDYRYAWNEQRPNTLYVVNAHSLYLEVLGESGLVGLALLATPLLAALGCAGLARRRSREVPASRDVAVALCAAGVMVLHAGIDWDWQLPSVTLPAVVLGACGLKAASRRAGWDRPAGWFVRVPIIAAAVTGVLLLAGPTGAAILVEQGKHQAADRRLEAALATARDAVRLHPAAAGPRVLQGDILADLGRDRRADAAFAAALRRAPRDWEVMADWAGVLLRRGDRAAAIPLIRRAKRLNPREERVAVLMRVAGVR